MSVKIILITHENIGESLINSVQSIIGSLPLPIFTFTVTTASNYDSIKKQLQLLVYELANHDGILILTDIFGATPYNIATSVDSKDTPIKIISGLNLPMLIRLMNYPKLNLEQLANKALTGGIDGIVQSS